MNYSSLSIRRPEIEKPKLSERYNKLIERIQTIYETLQHLFGLIIGFPLFILEYVFGIDVVEQILSCCSPLCPICMCGAFIGILSSIGIGLGVGLGVGLNCAKIQHLSNQTSTNITV